MLLIRNAHCPIFKRCSRLNPLPEDAMHPVVAEVVNVGEFKSRITLNILDREALSNIFLLS
jgi:hypothetical protein